MAVVHSVELPNRVTLQYVEQGDSSGIPVVLLHGATDSWRSFEPVLPHLPASLRAFALTLRGHGDASRPAFGYRYADFAADLAAVMDRLALESAVVVGHSMGRAIAQRFAIDNPERTLGLVLIGAFAGEPHNPAILEIENAISTQVDPIDAGFVREFQLSTLANPVPPGFLATVVEESRKVPVRVWRELFAGIREDDVAAELGEIRAQTLIVTGDRDGFATPAQVEALAKSLAGARLVIYHGVGHALHWEQPARFAADLIEFTNGLKSRSHPGTLRA